MDKRKIRFEWPELKLSVRADLAVNQNPELCERVWNELPFQSIMNNAVVTDGSMYCWVPMLSFEPVHVKERIDTAPIGRLRYSQNTGNKIILQYAQCNENIMGAVLGQVDDCDLPILRQVGKEAEKAIFLTKKALHVKIMRNVDSGAGSGKSTPFCSVECSSDVTRLVTELYDLGMKASREESCEHVKVRTGQNSGMGSCGQYFSTWEFVYSLGRDVSMYTLYPIARLCRDTTFSLEQLERVFEELVPTYTNLLGSYGMHDLRRMIDSFCNLIRQKKLNRDEFRCVIDAFTFYTNMLAQWAYFQYPWGIGCACFRFDENHQHYTPSN